MHISGKLIISWGALPPVTLQFPEPIFTGQLAVHNLSRGSRTDLAEDLTVEHGPCCGDACRVTIDGRATA